MGTLKFWLLLAAAQILILIALAVASPVTQSTPALRYLGYVCIAGIFASVPPIMIKAFVAAQAKIGNGALPMVQAIANNQTAITVGVWVLIGAALTMAMPQIRADIAADRATTAATDSMGVNAGATKAALESSVASQTANAAVIATQPSDTSFAGTNATTQTSAAPLTEPGAGSATRTAILDIVRFRLKTKARFKVDHIRVAGEWAFLRATEVVELDEGELQETDLTVAALLNRSANSSVGDWRIVEMWTLPDEQAHPFASFIRSVRERVQREKLPTGLLPDDFNQ